MPLAFHSTTLPASALHRCNQLLPPPTGLLIVRRVRIGSQCVALHATISVLDQLLATLLLCSTYKLLASSVHKYFHCNMFATAARRRDVTVSLVGATFLWPVGRLGVAVAQWPLLRRQPLMNSRMHAVWPLGWLH